MGKVQKILWWILWYAVAWVGMLFLLMIPAAALNAPAGLAVLLMLAIFIVPGWYATRKVKQKALKLEMEQRATGAAAAEQTSRQGTANPPTAERPDSVPAPSSTPQIPPVGPMAPAAAAPIPASAPASIQTSAPEKAPSPRADLPDINQATVEQLANLSTVNRILASKIISVRDREGPYASLEDLFSRVQLSQHVQEEIRRNYTAVSLSEGRIIDF